MWATLSILAIVSLILFWKGPNAVWGCLTFGLVGGLVTATVYFMRGFGFSWMIVGKWLVVCALLGFGAELIGRWSQRKT